MIHEVAEMDTVLLRHLRAHIFQSRVLDFSGIIGALDMKLLLHSERVFEV
jgi:hypothetical protein